jgi:hypothetical protein
MTNLTIKQVASINKMFRFLMPKIALGTILYNMIAAINNVVVFSVDTGTPVNAANANKLLTIGGAVFNAETVTIGSDIYEFVSSTALIVTTPGNIPVDINAHTAKASVLLTIDTNPIAGDTMTIDGKVFTFVPINTATADGEIDIAVALATTQTNIVAAIMGTDVYNEPHESVKTTAGFIANVLTITAIYGGAAGNSLAVSQTLTAASNIFSAATLGGGGSCIASNAVIALALAVTTSDTEGVGAVDSDGDTVLFTADVAGVAGNAIAIAENMQNGSFAAGAVLLSGGINGTVGIDGDMYKNSTDLFISVGVSTITTKNWRKVSLGSAY